jgi:hypothetical protein
MTDSPAGLEDSRLFDAATSPTSSSPESVDAASDDRNVGAGAQHHVSMHSFNATQTGPPWYSHSTNTLPGMMPVEDGIAMFNSPQFSLLPTEYQGYA